MRQFFSVIFLLLSSSSLYGQLESNSLIITASRETNLQPDTAVFGIIVNSDLSASLDGIIAALQGSGITASNFVEVSSVGGPPVGAPTAGALAKPGLQWIFDLPVPFSKMRETTGLLARIRDAVAKQNNGLTMTFNVQGTLVSPQLQQSQQCSMPDLLADARSQAQSVANATGFSVGQVLAMSSGQVAQPVLQPRAGNFTSSAFLVGTFSVALFQIPPSSPVICSLTVKFGLLRFH